MSGSSPFDLFSQGSGKSQPAKKPTEKKQVRAPKSKKNPKEAKKLKWKARSGPSVNASLLEELQTASLKDPELEKLFQEVEGTVQKINKAVDAACESNSLSRKEVVTLLDDPKNLPGETPEEVAVLKEYLTLKKQSYKTAKSKLRRSSAHRDKSGKALQGKSIGNRRRWLPMD